MEQYDVFYFYFPLLRRQSLSESVFVFQNCEKTVPLQQQHSASHLNELNMYSLHTALGALVRRKYSAFRFPLYYLESFCKVFKPQFLVYSMTTNFFRKLHRRRLAKKRRQVVVGLRYSSTKCPFNRLEGHAGHHGVERHGSGRRAHGINCFLFYRKCPCTGCDSCFVQRR